MARYWGAYRIDGKARGLENGLAQGKLCGSGMAKAMSRGQAVCWGGGSGWGRGPLSFIGQIFIEYPLYAKLFYVLRIQQ